MKATSQTIQQIERALRKVAAKYPEGRVSLAYASTVSGQQVRCVKDSE